MTNNLEKYRLQLIIKGVVQGVGFRPFIYRLARELKLCGWVNNSAPGVFIEVEGTKLELETFLHKIQQEKPPVSLINSIEISWLKPVNYTEFTIRPSVKGEKTALVLPDLATCPDCLQEIFSPRNRRYNYPFTNCTNCGPRYSIINSLPYDRQNTTMQTFTMCPECLAEYQNPLNRRFHAQPNACPKCGPHLELWSNELNNPLENCQPLSQTAIALREGKIVAIKGLGGFHLMVDARNQAAVARLRQRKHRPDKPFALMYPSLKSIKADCQLSDLEASLLQSPQAPIVLLQRKDKTAIAPAVAPKNPYLGIMLPYTPLHHLLMVELGFPLVATSGNLSNEPICIDETEALSRLATIADLFLVHNRPIVRAVDDSIVRVIDNHPVILRRGRGYAPLPISLKVSNPKTRPKKILAVGGNLKNTIAISFDNQIFLSQHIGNLANIQAFEAFQTTIKSLSSIYDFQPEVVVCDIHPDYLSSQFAQQLNIPVISVQHHYAHILACMADNQLEAPVLGIAWDGTGYGLDGTVWGGEFLQITPDSFRRVAHLYQFRLPGGEKAVKEPCRSAIGLLYTIFGDRVFQMRHLPPIQAFSPQELAILSTMLEKNINSPLTSSAGRLFDAVAAILGIRQKASFEGQAAMELEFAIGDLKIEEEYKISIKNGIIDFRPMIISILEDVYQNISLSIISAKFHNSLITAMINLAKIFNLSKNIVLSGGCWQNKYLLTTAIRRFQLENFVPYYHHHIPTNDGGIAVGQIIAALITVNSQQSTVKNNY